MAPQVAPQVALQVAQVEQVEPGEWLRPAQFATCESSDEEQDEGSDDEDLGLLGPSMTLLLLSL